jgi:hypothetical protein
VGSNLRIDTRRAWPDQASSLVFFATGRHKPSRSYRALTAGLLFDKWFEERETQAAESWRIHWARKRLADRTDSGDFCVSAITMARQVRGNPGRMRFV